jgi:hypothetical protein
MRVCRHLALAVVSLYLLRSSAQTVSPVIVEYIEHGEGKIELTNGSLRPLIVVLEPKSFTITPDGTGIYRPLDPDIHVELSAMSVRLLPKQSYTVFYKAKADTLPAWFTIYAAFSSPQTTPGLNLRIMLPHTVYLCQKNPLPKESVAVSNVYYYKMKRLVEFDIANRGRSYGRLRSGFVNGGHDSAGTGGFALLPGGSRHIEIRWTSNTAPQQLRLHFDNFDIKQPIEAKSDGALALTTSPLGEP